MKQKVWFSADNEGIGKGTDYIREYLSSTRIKGSKYTKAVLTSEEAISNLVAHTKEGENYAISAGSFLGTVTVTLESRGEEYDMEKSMADASLDMTDALEENTDMGLEAQDTIRSILLRSLTDSLKCRHKDGVNRIRMTVVRNERSFLYMTLGAMILAIIFAIILNIIGNVDFNKVLIDYILSPLKTMYMNSLRMIVGPVVFFSILSCIIQFTELSELGRIGGKVFILYACTTFLAVGVGTGTFFIFKPGSGMDLSSMVADAPVAVSSEVNISLLDTLVGIVPDNIVGAFLESNMLQLIFLAIISGIAIGKIGKYAKPLVTLIESCNEFVLMVTSFFIKLMPLAVFCSITEMVLKLGADKLVSVLSIFGTFLMGTFFMMVVYCILLAVIGRVNPFTLMRKYAPTMLQVLSLNSSSAAIPINMEACEKKLGIAKKIYSLSIPLGATVNMDGTCIRLSVAALALANLYGIEITGAGLFAMVLSIVVLSVGTPGIPGAGLVATSVLFTQMGIPLEGLGLILGIDSFLGMVSTMNNCVGDVAVSTIVAKSENLLNMEVFKS